MRDDRIEADYLVETPLDPGKVAAIVAGEQSSGTFVRVAGETDELRERAAAEVLGLEELAPLEAPSLRSAWLERKGVRGPWRRFRLCIGYPVANVGVNLPTLAATVGGNLFDLGEVTGLRLLDVRLPRVYRNRYERPAVGVAGTRRLLGIEDRPVFGTIVKPNVGLRPDDIAALVGRLCEAGVDFIKDDEICVDPDHAPLERRIAAVMEVIRDHRERTGREIMYAFNISDEAERMCRHAERVEAAGGNCIMASLNWCGLSALQTLRRSTGLAIHAHRNGYGAFARHPALGIGVEAYQTLYRLTGIDHLHVHGIGGKFADDEDEVRTAARRCLAPLAPRGDDDDVVMPTFSSGQWAGTLGVAVDVAGSPDFMFLCGGGIIGHPQGPAAGVRSLADAWEATSRGADLASFARSRPALAAAIDRFGDGA